MNKTGVKIVLGIILIIGLAFSSPLQMLAEATSLSEINAGKKDAEDTKSSSEAELGELQSYITQLNDGLADANAKLGELDIKLGEKKKEIEETAKSLEEAKVSEKKQYDSMKLRIKYMYENGGSSYVDAILGAGSFAEFVNRVEFISKISDYDRSMLENYKNTKKSIEDKNNDLIAQKEELEGLYADAQAEQAAAAELVSSTNARIADCVAKIDSADQALKEYEESLKALEGEMGTGGYDNIPAFDPSYSYEDPEETGGIDLSASDLDMLAAIIECEAGGEGYEEMLGVGAVVMNRLKDPRYPDTMVEVLYQSWQFEPVGTGRFAVVLARGAMPICYEAARAAMSGQSNVGDAIGFKLASTGIEGIVIGKIVFFNV